MSRSKLLCGPILGAESQGVYSCLVVAQTSAKQVQCVVSGSTSTAEFLAELPTGVLWRMALPMTGQANDNSLSYRIHVDGQPAMGADGQTEWRCAVPVKGQAARLAYASCNGFSDQKLLTSTERPYAMWDKLLEEHRRDPYSLLIMGGDQVYADALWSTLPALAAWNELALQEKISKKPSKAMVEQLERFYCELYLKRWSQPSVASALASIPSIMMWDDHDIFDGWGSYPEPLQRCPVYALIFNTAQKYFGLFQRRGQTLASGAGAGQSRPLHHAYSLGFYGFDIIALDHRSQRTRNRIMDEDQWQFFSNQLKASQSKHLLILSGVPVVYRDFSKAEQVMDLTPWEEELTDDLKDHWRAREHQGERARFIMKLLDKANQTEGRTVVLSGDVHVGCMGVVRDQRAPSKSVSVHQLVSSGIVHPAPTALQWAGVLASSNDCQEFIDEHHQISCQMIKPFGSSVYLRTRNFLSLKEGTDGKLWATWHCENGEKAEYPLSGV